MVIIKQKELNVLLIPLIFLIFIVPILIFSLPLGKSYEKEPAKLNQQNRIENTLEEQEIMINVPNTPGTPPTFKNIANDNLNGITINVVNIDKILNEKLLLHGLNPTLYNTDQKVILHKGIEAGIDIKKYSDPRFSAEQMNEILIGLQKGLDVSKYTKKIYSPSMMRQIREKLESEK